MSSASPPAATTPGVITCRNLVVSAGLHASKLARTLSYGDGYSPPETYYAKGQYYALSGPSPFKRHIYPMPDGAWLGLHATVDIGGRCKFGPDIEWTDGIDYSFQPEKLEKFLDFIRSYYPGLDASRLHADYTGVRPKLYREGEPVPDFAIHGPDAARSYRPGGALRHREPGADGGAGDRRAGGGDAAGPSVLVATRRGASPATPLGGDLPGPPLSMVRKRRGVRGPPERAWAVAQSRSEPSPQLPRR